MGRFNRLAIVFGILFVLGVPTFTLVKEQIEREKTFEYLWGECKNNAFARGGQINDLQFKNCVDVASATMAPNIQRILFRDIPLRMTFAAILAIIAYAVIAGIVLTCKWVARGQKSAN